jgi:hypothetical protein
MSILGGSPLGLVGLGSVPTRDGMSTFNGGKSRNVNINDYNVGKSAGRGNVSLFTGGSKFNAWPNISVAGTDKDTTGLKGSYKGLSRSALHNNDIYDTSILNIIEKLSGTAGALRPQDFAYLKDLGVYPNNRLIIARRFRAPVRSDYIFTKRGALPMAVMITWKKQDEDFFTIDFGEEWEDAKASFTDVLNNIGKDFLGNKLSDKVTGALGGVPLPGFTEATQRKILTSLGVLDDSGNEPLPAGDPNLIKEAKRRKTVGYNVAGSGLKCTFSVTMLCEYEQKFISGIDPTIVWQDILMNALNFGTSKSTDYGLSDGFGAKLKKWVRDPMSLVEDFAVALSESIKDIVNDIFTAITDSLSSLEAKAEGLSEEFNKAKAEQAEKLKEDQLKKAESELGELNNQDTPTRIVDPFTGNVIERVVKPLNSIAKEISKTIQKYEHEIKGIVNALSGAPSTPWHVTIGNPLKPIFAAGDMLVESVKVTPGPDLAFNDLPSRIKVEFTLKNARPWGLQEIAANFNVGNIRVYNPIKDFTTISPEETLLGNKGVYDTEEGSTETTNGDSQVSNNSAGDNNNNIQKTSQNSKTEVINSDANSIEVTINEG